MLVVLVIELIIGSVITGLSKGRYPSKTDTVLKPSMYVQMETDQE